MANIVDFGAIGDDKADNTEIIQNLIDSKKSIYIPKGIFRVTKLIIDNKNIKIRGRGTLKCNSKLYNNLSFIYIDSPATIDGITIDGNKKTRQAIEINSQNVAVKNCEIKNVYALNSEDSAIGLATYKGKVTIQNCHFHHIYAEPNNKLSDSAGASRAIIVGEYDQEDIEDLTIIKDCNFYLIQGEEGDCIQSEAKSSKTVKALLIENCKFNDFSRRAIKLSASNATIKGCTITNHSNYKNLFSAVSAFGSNVKIVDNTIDTYYADGIELGNDDVDIVVSDYLIKNNTILNYKEPNDGNESYGIIAMNIVDCSIVDNKIYRRAKESAAINIKGCKKVFIYNNSIFGGNKLAMEINSSNYSATKDLIVENNFLKDSKAKYFIVAEHINSAIFKNNRYKTVNKNSEVIYTGKKSKNITLLNNTKI